MKRITENVAIISALFIFIGYLNYYFYYLHFGIEIGSFLSTTELIFSFLPLSIPILLVFGSIILVMFISPILAGRAPALSRTEFFIATKHIVHTQDIRNRIRRLQAENDGSRETLILIIWGYFGLVVSIIVNILIGVFPMFIIINADERNTLHLDSWRTFSLGILWLSLIYVRLDSVIDKKEKEAIRIFWGVLVVTLSIFLLKTENKERALSVLGGKSINMSINLNDGQTIRTDSGLVFIGKTSTYIFLRSLSKKENLILKMDNVKQLRTSKNDVVPTSDSARFTMHFERSSVATDGATIVEKNDSLCVDEL